jgi:hypothetical protein
MGTRPSNGLAAWAQWMGEEEILAPLRAASQDRDLWRRVLLAAHGATVEDAPRTRRSLALAIVRRHLSDERDKEPLFRLTVLCGQRLVVADPEAFGPFRPTEADAAYVFGGRVKQVHMQTAHLLVRAGACKTKRSETFEDARRRVKGYLVADDRRHDR